MISDSKNSSSAPLATRNPPRIRDYELLRLIGEGSFGEVWLARGVAGVYRAVKIVRRSSTPEDRCFEREFAGLQRFESISRKHPGWVSVLHVGKDDRAGFFYYVMEAADDCLREQKIIPDEYTPRTLSSDLGLRGKLPIKECVRLGLSLSAALEELHRHKLAHRDIKPSNVIYVNNEPKLADIGLVVSMDEPPTTLMGTNGYFPPTGSGTTAGDIFSLGKLLYVAWTDFDANRFPELPTDVSSGCDRGLALKLNGLILKACEPEAERRFKSAQAMHDSLRLLTDEPRTSRGLKGNSQGTATVSSEACIAIVGSSGGESCEQVAALLEEAMTRNGYPVVLDRHNGTSMEWAWKIGSIAPKAAAVVALLSADTVHSEMLAYELELAREAGLRRGRPIVIPIRIQYPETLPSPVSNLLKGAPFLDWMGPEDNLEVAAEVLKALDAPAEWRPVEPSVSFEPPWGAIPVASTFYVMRPVDHQFRAAIGRRDSIVLLRGARQMGKSSLLARGLDDARAREVLVVLTDFQGLSSSDFESLDRFYQALGNSITDQLELDVTPAQRWDSGRSPNTNFDRFLRREVFDSLNAQIVWGLDEVDRLFTCPFGTEVFGLFRSWHNKRALDPDGHWGNLTLAIAYATEAHLFISDLNQSPFNVGTALALGDFDLEQVRDLNGRYGSPLKSDGEVSSFFRLVNGHPFLVRRALHELAVRTMAFPEFEAQASRDEGLFGDHLRRVLVTLTKDSRLLEVVRAALEGAAIDAESFYRLRSAGVMTGETACEARIRCQVYAEYLRRHLL